MTKLQDVFNNHTDRFSGKWTHYFDVYDRYLQHLIGQEFTLLEIGVSQGGSLQIWKKYFGSKVKIVGIDIDQNSMFTEDQITTFCGSQTNNNFLQHVLSQITTPTVIIDDGSHVQFDVLTTFNYLYPELACPGFYIIEDVHTAYWLEYQGGINSPFNAVTVASRMVHDVNQQWIKQPYQTTLKDIKSIAFYDSMIVFEKDQLIKPTPAYTVKKDIPRHTFTRDIWTADCQVASSKVNIDFTPKPAINSAMWSTYSADKETKND